MLVMQRRLQGSKPHENSFVLSSLSLFSTCEKKSHNIQIIQGVWANEFLTEKYFYLTEFNPIFRKVNGIDTTDREIDINKSLFTIIFPSFVKCEVDIQLLDCAVFAKYNLVFVGNEIWLKFFTFCFSQGHIISFLSPNWNWNLSPYSITQGVTTIWEESIRVTIPCLPVVVMVSSSHVLVIVSHP